MSVRFEWDSRKAERNQNKHGISSAKLPLCFKIRLPSFLMTSIIQTMSIEN